MLIKSRTCRTSFLTNRFRFTVSVPRTETQGTRCLLASSLFDGFEDEWSILFQIIYELPTHYMVSNSRKQLSIAFWVIMTFYLEKVQCFGTTYQLHLQGKKVGQAWNQQKPAVCSVQQKIVLFIIKSVRISNWMDLNAHKRSSETLACDLCLFCCADMSLPLRQ